MGPPLAPAPLDAIRALFAQSVGGAGSGQRTLGRIELRDAQLDAAARLQRALERFGGALLADDVGFGKTFTALAVARSYQRVCVVAPATLRLMWAHASTASGVAVDFVSTERLSRGRVLHTSCDLVIVDEAHHFRNPAARRYPALRLIASRAHVLLLSATPVHNSARDLDALCALFLGEAAHDLDDERRAQLIIRTTGSIGGPRVDVHEPTAVPDNADIVRSVLALPSVVAPVDGGDAPALFRLALLRAWCSSVAAFSAMLRRAMLHASALADSLRAGRHPTRAELSAWSLSGDGQLAFPELVASRDARIQADRIDPFIDALTRLRSLAARCVSNDDDRARHVADIADRHYGLSVLLCAQYRATIDAIWSRLRSRPGVAMLSARGGRIASGPLARDAVLLRFSPRSHGAARPHERERITLLLATDLVSEGLNLQDAAVVVHADLPWTAARLAQRAGRVARTGSTHHVVHVYTLAPPIAAAAMLDLEGRINRKRVLGARLAGGSTQFARLLGGAAQCDESAAESRARAVARLERFRSHAAAEGVCAIVAPCTGWIALVRATGGDLLVARLGRDAASAHPRIVARAIELLAQGAERPLPHDWARAYGAVRRWVERARGRSLSGADRKAEARSRRAGVGATVGSVAAAPAHARAAVAAGASAELSRIPAPFALGHALSIAALVVFCLDDTGTSRDTSGNSF